MSGNRVVALGVGVLLASSALLAACGSSPSADTSTTTTATPSARSTTTSTSSPAPASTTTTVAPTTTTAPPATTTTVANGPQLLVLEGGTPVTQPSSFDYAQDGTGSVSGLTWSSWSSAGATGTGTLNVTSCTPNCAQGATSSYPATVTLSGAQQTSQGYLFTSMDISVPSAPDESQSFTLPR